MMYYYNKNKLKIAGLVEESIVDGPGIRFVVFTQGCPHDCKGCHNPQTHDFNLGEYINIDDLAKRINSNPLLKGVTLSGGEPFMQCEALVELISKLNNNLDIITYSGFTFEEIVKKANNENRFMDLLNYTDILIDGRFEEEKKDENLAFRGSSNQRAINVKLSLKNKKIIEYEF